MLHLLYALLATVRSGLKPQRELALENLALRQQLAIVQRKTNPPNRTQLALDKDAPEPRKRESRDGVCLLKTPSRAESLTCPRSGSSSPTPMRHLLYALLATARSSLKSQRELALENLALRQQLAILHRKTKRPRRGPRILGRAPPSVARLAERPPHREARDRDSLAP